MNLMEVCPEHVRETGRQSSDMKGNGFVSRKERDVSLYTTFFLSVEEFTKFHTRLSQRAQ